MASAAVRRSDARPVSPGIAGREVAPNAAGLSASAPFSPRIRLASMNRFARSFPRTFARLLVGAWLLIAAPAWGVQEESNGEDYALHASYEIQEGTRQGRLRIHIDMPEHWHTYSLTQPSPPGPTLIEVAKSDAFRLTGPFAAEQKPKITENDPIFGKLEEHYDEVDFIAPLEVAPDAKLEGLKIELKVTCQVCSESTCEFLKKRALDVEFGGYYKPQPPPEKGPPADQPKKSGQSPQ